MNERYDIKDDMQQITLAYKTLEEVLLAYDDGLTDVQKAHLMFRISDVCNDLREHYLLMQKRAYANGRFLLHEAWMSSIDDNR